MPLAAAQVHVDLPGPERVGARSAPVDAGEEVGVALRSRDAPLHEEAVVPEPAVEVQADSVAVKPVIRDDEQRGVGFELVHDLADDRVHSLVDALHRVAVARREHRVVARVRGIEQPVEHVRHPIGLGEHRDEEVPVRPRELVQRARAHLVHRPVEVGEEGLLVDALGVERRRVLRPADGLVGAERRGELGGVARWRTDRNERRRRRIVQRREIDAQRLDRCDVEAAEPRDGDERKPERRNHRQLEGVPRAPAAARHTLLAAAEAHRHRAGGAVDVEPEVERQRRPAVAARVRWTRDVDLGVVTAERNREQPPAAGVRVRPRLEIAREIGERAVGAEQVRDAEPRQHPPPRHAVGRKGVRDAQHVHPDAVRGGDVPERRPLPAAVCLGTRRPEETPQELRRTDTAGADVRQVRRGVALDEVEDAVARRRRAGGKGRPGDGRLRRVGRRERAELATRRERLQVRQPPLLHPAREEPRIDAVEAEDDETSARVPPRIPPPATAARDQGDHEQHTHDVPQTAYSSGNSRSSSTRSLVTRMPRGESL